MGHSELHESNTFSDANELKARDTDSNGTDNYALTYNKRGDLTDDGVYEYVYDFQGRLRKVNLTGGGRLIAEYTYNGLGYRISWKYDSDADNDVDVNDKTYRFGYDVRWRIAATYLTSDSSPKEQYVFHNAGAGGFGGSSYIDAVILRDKDASTAWTSASDGTLEQRLNYCQNWRADVVAIIKSDGSAVREWVKYLSYGTPVGVARGDANYDGTVNSSDSSTFSTLWTAGQTTYNVQADMDLDGDNDSTDLSLFSSEWTTVPATGYDRLSRNDSTTSVENRIGYAGYQWDPVIKVYHVRYRVFDPETARWMTRASATRHTYGYVGGEPIGRVAPFGGGGAGMMVQPHRRPPRPSLCADNSSNYDECMTCCSELFSRPGQEENLAWCEVHCAHEYLPPPTIPPAPFPGQVVCGPWTPTSPPETDVRGTNDGNGNCVCTRKDCQGWARRCWDSRTGDEIVEEDETCESCTFTTPVNPGANCWGQCQAMHDLGKASCDPGDPRPPPPTEFAIIAPRLPCGPVWCTPECPC